MLKSIIDKLKNQRVMVVVGNHPDKVDFTWHLSTSLKSSLAAQEMNSSAGNVTIYESAKPIGIELLCGLLIGEDKSQLTHKIGLPRIFILLKTSPSDFDHDLEKVQHAAEQGDAYIISYTNQPVQDWGAKQTAFLLDVASLSYSPESLANIAIHRLSLKNLESPVSLEVENYIRSKVENQLENLTQVKTLVGSLAHQNKEIDFSIVDQAILLSQKNHEYALEEQFKRWSERKRLLALGVSFFQGLPIDQLFTALERVVEQKWQKRDPSLRALDCNDLHELSEYCQLLSSTYPSVTSLLEHVDGKNNFTEIELTRLVLNNPEDSRYVYAFAWLDYRRQIISALNGIADIVRDSAEPRKTSFDIELFGTPFQTQQLRQSIGNAFCELGLTHPSATNAIQNILFSLATSSSDEVRYFVAGTVMKWFSEPKQTQFWSTFHRIYEGAIIYSENQDISGNLGATTSILLGYACEATSGNLSDNLMDWLYEISESDNSKTKAYFGYAALPRALSHHLPQLCDFVNNFLERDGGLESEESGGMANAIGWSLAQAYSEYPNVVLELLEGWFQSWKKPIPRLTKTEADAANKLRDSWANVLAITLSEISFSATESEELLKQVFNYFLELLKGKNRETKKIALEALCNQVKNNFSVVSDAIRGSAENLSKSERTAVARVLSEVYIQQRKDSYTAGQGDGWFINREESYRFWSKGDRPRTTVERILLSWLGDKNSPASQQLAAEALIYFAEDFDLSEAKHVRDLQLNRGDLIYSDQIFQDYISLNNPISGLSGLWAWLSISPIALPVMIKERIWAPDIVRQYQPVIRNILPQAVIQSRHNNEAVQFVLSTWKESKLNKLTSEKDSPELTALAKFLSPSLWMAKNPWAFFLGASTVLWIGYSATTGTIDNIRMNIDRARYNSLASKSTPAPAVSETPSIIPPIATPIETPISRPTNIFESESFPRPTCGDLRPTSSSDYPVTFYPVFINYSESNLSRAKEQFCEDSIKNLRKSKGIVAVQVSSFTSPVRAEEFRAFLASRFGNAEIGDPLVIQKP
jgi:hypothetical protein